MSAVEVDEFWPQASLADAWREVEEFLEARDGGEVRLKLVGPQDEVLSIRRQRRVIQRRRLRGVRPADEVECKTTPWYRRPKKTSAKHPRYKRTKLVVSHGPDGSLVTDIKRCTPKPAPNRRRAAAPAIEVEPAAEDDLECATTEVVDAFDDSDVVLEKSSVDGSEVAVVMMPTPAKPSIDPLYRELVEPESEVTLELLAGDDADGIARDELSRHFSADHELVYAGGEPLYLSLQ